MGCLCEKPKVLELKRVPLTPPPPDWNCVICLDEEYVDHLQAASCGHVYHQSCIQLWSRKKNACPICQYKIY